jgi:pyrimidine-specific ribonucleoside hydrolase
MLLAGPAALLSGRPLSELLDAASWQKVSSRSIPVVHITDLYHPPQDPDDHIDLATVVALDEYDVKGVILDASQKFLQPAPAGFDISREPGFIPVAQLGYLLGRSIPVAAGPTEPLKSPDDDATDRPVAEQGGIRMLIDILEQSPETVVLSVVGSARVVTAAYNRRPDLLRRKTRFVLLNVGSTGGSKREWNVALDLNAYVGLWRSSLPIWWFPCGTESGAFNADHERGTFWKTKHRRILGSLSPSFRAWFAFALSGSRRPDFIEAIVDGQDSGAWRQILDGDRNLWSTASLIMGAGRVLAKTGAGWRFVPSAIAAGYDLWDLRMDNIEATVDGDAHIDWALSEEGKSRLFHRRRGEGFADAMAEALNALLGSLS